MSTSHVLGIDLGGTKVEACLMDSDRRCLARERIPSQPDMGLDRVILNIKNLARKVAGAADIRAVGIGTPGTFDAEEGRLCGAPHTPVYETVGFMHRLEKALERPLLVENDANCLALAEFFASCKGTYRYVMAVILGTGMGAGLILDDRLYTGAKGGAGEIGHATVDVEGRLCECGRRGCAEAYLSGPSHTRRFEEKTGRRLPLQQIFKLYQGGDRDAAALFEESLRIMGEIFADMINVLDLEAIILGGGVSNLPIWYDRLESRILPSLFGVPRKEIPIIPARMGDSAGVLGAAYLALRYLGLMSF
jgi:fructokinase